MIKSPFKFLDSYTREDREIFFGRDQEITELYRKVFESKILLVYGVSGTGKSSLINCGLASRFDESDWLPLNVRRGSNIIESLNEAFNKQAIRPLKKNNSISEKLQSIYLDHFKPVYLIFDQFEELFIFGDKEERREFVQIVKTLTESDLQCRLIFVMREEYMAGVTEFETLIPTFFNNRVRIEKMSHINAIETIQKPCKVFNIKLEEGFAETLLEKLSPGSTDVELTFLQVFLDKIFRLAQEESATVKEMEQLTFTLSLLQRTGNVSDLLWSFLDDQISLMEDPDISMTVLKTFVSGKGTKRPANESETIDNVRSLGKKISQEKVTELLQTFVKLRVLKDKDDHGRYELRHDVLGEKIFEKFSLAEKELLEIRQMIENAYQYYLKRKILLNSDDLAYISNKDSLLNMNADLKRFLQESRKYQVALRKALKRLIAVSALALIILLTTIIYTISKKTKISNAYRYAFESITQFTKPVNRLCTAADAWTTNNSETSKGALFEAFNSMLKQPESDKNTDTIKSLYRKEFTPISSPIEFALCSNDNRYIYGYSRDSVIIWNKEGKIISKFKVGKSPIMNLIMSNNSEYIGGITLDSVLTVWDKDGEANFIKKIRYNPININQTFRFTKDNNILTLSNEHDAELLDVKGKCIQVFDHHKGSVNGLDASDDGRFIATASSDSTIGIWYLNSDKKLFEIYNTIGINHDTVWSVDFAPDSKYILSTSKDRSVRVTSINNDYVWGRRKYINFEDYNQISMYPTLAEFDRSGTGITVKSFESDYKKQNPFIFGIYYGIYEVDVTVDQIKKFDNLCFSPDKQNIVYVYGDETILASRQQFQVSHFSIFNNCRLLRLNGQKPFFSQDGKYIYTICDKHLESWFIDTETIYKIAMEYEKNGLAFFFNEGLLYLAIQLAPYQTATMLYVIGKSKIQEKRTSLHKSHIQRS